MLQQSTEVYSINYTQNNNEYLLKMVDDIGILP